GHPRAERPAQRAPEQLRALPRHGLDVVHRDGGPALAHGANYAVRRLTAGRTRRRAGAQPGGMASKSTTTTDHDEIRRWVEEHGGKPASVRGTENGDGAGVLR